MRGKTTFVAWNSMSIPDTIIRCLYRTSVAAGFFLLSLPALHGQTPAAGETLVLIRHGEKPAGGLGQLSCKGLNRALALPSVLVSRYGRPDFLFAPDPSRRVRDGKVLPTYYYVRPLETIEPTAILLGMPVNTQIGSDRIRQLQKTLVQPAYAHSLIFAAWEHNMLYLFAELMMRSYGNTPMHLPAWAGNDYETVYVFHITRTGKNNAPRATMEIQKEGLSNLLSDACPGPQ